jgi:hypothetical protein
MVDRAVEVVILKERKRRYQFISDLGTEMALRWSLSQHDHGMDLVRPGCHWCDIESLVIANGHMASKKNPPKWWNEFVLEWKSSWKARGTA